MMDSNDSADLESQDWEGILNGLPTYKIRCTVTSPRGG